MYNSRPNPQPQRSSFDFERKPFFENGKVNLKWVSDYAKDLAKVLSDNNLTSSQMRNFYNEFLRIRNMPKNAAEEKRVHIKMLVAKVNYKHTTNKIAKDYVTFISSLVSEVGDDLKKFEDACHIMEALLAYNPKVK